MSSVDAYLRSKGYAVDALGERASEWNDRLPPHFSVNQLQLFFKCPEQYRREKVLGERGPTNEKLFVGSSVHEGVERALRHRLDTGVDLELAEAVTAFEEVWWPRRLEIERESLEGDLAWDEGSGEERARRRAAQMLGIYLRDVAPRLRPLALEEGFLYPIEGCAVPVKGFIDIRQADSAIDMKTSTRKQDKLGEGWRLQGAVYNAVTGLPIEFHTISNSPKTNLVSIVTPLESEDLLVNPSANEHSEYMRTIRALVGGIAATMERYGPDEHWPTFGIFHSYACDRCAFRSSCPAWGA